eukprot:885074-Heterocapsa_arctica.AAC.1
MSLLSSSLSAISSPLSFPRSLPLGLLRGLIRSRSVGASTICPPTSGHISPDPWPSTSSWFPSISHRRHPQSYPRHSSQS